MQASDFFFNGQVQLRSPDAHPNDHRGTQPSPASGVTKREMFAAMFMAALIQMADESADCSTAVKAADMLLKELSK